MDMAVRRTGFEGLVRGVTQALHPFGDKGVDVTFAVVPVFGDIAYEAGIGASGLEQLPRRLVDISEVVVAYDEVELFIGINDGSRHVVEDKTDLGFLLGQRLLGPLAVGDVDLDSAERGDRSLLIEDREHDRRQEVFLAVLLDHDFPFDHFLGLDRFPVETGVVVGQFLGMDVVERPSADRVEGNAVKLLVLAVDQPELAVQALEERSGGHVVEHGLHLAQGFLGSFAFGDALNVTNRI